jgi:cytochrome c oxidase subunit 2
VAKWWGALFGVTLLGCFLLFLVAPFVGWWLPEGASTFAPQVDSLYYIILGITGFFFVLTEGLLVYFMIRFGAPELGQPVKARPALEEKTVAAIKKIIPNEHRLELAWTIVPAAILLYIAFAQVSTWADMKYQSQMPPELHDKHIDQQLVVSARQFEWRMRYPSPETIKKWQESPKLGKNWFRNPELDDVHVVNELHCFTDKEKEGSNSHTDFPAFVVYLSTLDVQHNLNLPNFRVKQDALPGKIIPVWFRPTKANGEWKADKKIGGKVVRSHWQYAQDGGKDRIWEIACAELCGRWHYHMVGKVYVHPSRQNYLDWLESAAAAQNQYQRSAVAASK